VVSRPGGVDGGQANLQRKRPAAALPLLQRTIELREGILDPISPALAESQVTLAECYLDLGDSTRAKELAIQAQKIYASHHDLNKIHGATAKTRTAASPGTLLSSSSSPLILHLSPQICF